MIILLDNKMTQLIDPSKTSPLQYYQYHVEAITGISTQCDPLTHPIKCPLIVYAILIIIAIIVVWVRTTSLSTLDRDGNDITHQQKLITASCTAIIMVILSFVVGGWIVYHCRQCSNQGEWLLFIIALISPLIIVLIGGLIAGSLLKVGFIFSPDGVKPSKMDTLLLHGTDKSGFFI